MLLAESKEDLQRVVNEFYYVCKKRKRKLKVNAGESKVMLFERREGEVIDFNVSYRAGVGNLFIIKCQYIIYAKNSTTWRASQDIFIRYFYLFIYLYILFM